MKELLQFGWNPFFEAEFSDFQEQGFEPARVAVEHRNYYELYSTLGEVTADKSGKLFYDYDSKESLPAVGDWVVIKHIPNEPKAQIDAVLGRRTKFSRKTAGAVTEEQIVAANIDILFVMNSLDQDLNPRRIERYLTLAWDSGIQPVIVLNKLDLCENLDKFMIEVNEISFGTPVHVVSALNKTHIEELLPYFDGFKTIAVVGSSGVGKSTLINDLCDGTKMKVNNIGKYKDKGKHTTSHRELIVVPTGGLIIDTPGMREIQLWEGGEGLAETFEDIESLALNCRFTDCKHESEPGCAVKAAIKSGEVEVSRFKSYRKLLNEIKYFENKQNIRAQLNEKRRWKKLTETGRAKGKAKH